MITWYFHCFKHATHKQKPFIQARAHNHSASWPRVSAHSHGGAHGLGVALWVQRVNWCETSWSKPTAPFGKDELNQASSCALVMVGLMATKAGGDGRYKVWDLMGVSSADSNHCLIEVCRQLREYFSQVGDETPLLWSVCSTGRKNNAGLCKIICICGFTCSML